MRLRAAIVTLTLLLTAGCDSGECDKGYKPYDCNPNEPGIGTVHVEVTINSLNTVVPIVVYEGPVENNVVVFEDTLDVPDAEYRMPNADYSIRARYRSLMGRDTVTIYAIDGSQLKASSAEYCDGTCWSEGNCTLDGRLD